MPPDVIDYILNYFGCRRPRRHEPPSVPIAERGMGQADCVLALLRANLRTYAELLVGHPIRHCPPCLRPRAPLVMADTTCPDMRRITRVDPNPRHPAMYRAHYRYAIFKEGMTVQNFLTRGGTRRDVREALRHDWIQLS